jgi:hypothetical protein
MKRGTIDIRASTLSEILIVMVLTGIILLSVFDGFSLFQRLLLRIQDKLGQSIERMDNYYRLELLFTGSDSVRGDEARMELYRQGAIRHQLLIDDSLLIAIHPGTTTKPDTLLRQVSEFAVIRNRNFPERIDSLQVRNDTVMLLLGIRDRPEDRTETEVRELEQSYHTDEN